jgi:hypothetical protein
MIRLTMLMLALGFAAASVGAGPQSILDRPIEQSPFSHPRHVTNVGAAAAILSLTAGAQVPVIFEEADGSAVPGESVPGEPLHTARQYLDVLVRADPRYQWREAEGVVVVRPIASMDDTKNELNRHLPYFAFQSSGDRQYLLQTMMKLLVPGAARIVVPVVVPEWSDPGPPIDVTLRNVTVLDVFCAVAKADGGIALAVRRRSIFDDPLEPYPHLVMTMLGRGRHTLSASAAR